MSGPSTFVIPTKTSPKILEMSAAGSDTKASGSLADRITMPPNAITGPGGPEVMNTWANEIASPTARVSKSLEAAQIDGNAETLGGSGLHDGEYEVEVKLSDLQGDTSSPLYSIQSFEQLGM
jgi:ATP-dependent RNA helicase DDX19/DBP5